MPRLFLVRHGNTRYNDERRFLGHTDIELSSSGKAQVNLLSTYLASEKIDAVYASDLKRTLTTAYILTSTRQLEISPCSELRETDYGKCEGLTYSEIQHKYPVVARQCNVFDPDIVFPQGESFRNFARRVIGFLKRLTTLPSSDTALIVSHNGPLKVLIFHYLGLPLKHWGQMRLDTASLSIIEISPRGPVLTRMNDTSFLKHGIC